MMHDPNLKLFCLWQWGIILILTSQINYSLSTCVGQRWTYNHEKWSLKALRKAQMRLSGKTGFNFHIGREILMLLLLWGWLYWVVMKLRNGKRVRQVPKLLPCFILNRNSNLIISVGKKSWCLYTTVIRLIEYQVPNGKKGLHLAI